MTVYKRRKNIVNQTLLNTEYGRRTTGYGKGVTLIELIMVITIVGILTTVSSLYIKETIDLWSFLSFRSEAVAQGRTALLRMEREIRQIKDNASIALADSTQLRFISVDLNGDGSDDTIEFVRNSANNELRRIFNNDNSGQGYVLASGVTDDAIFTYYNAANSPLAAPVSDTTQIYRINIELEISAGTQTKTLKTLVYPRNL